MYSEHIMSYVRQNLGLNGNDNSQDQEIMKMPKSEILDRVCEWEGLINYGSTIKQWIEDIYGIKLPD